MVNPSSDKSEKIKSLVEPILSRLGGYYVVDVEITASKIPLVWVYLDSEKGGISLDTCAEVSRELSVLLDAHEVFASSFRLNVSSPGLDRPLKDRRQFYANVGRNAKLTLSVGENKKVAVKGILKSVSESGVVLETAEGSQDIPFSQLIETKIIPAF
jgi:ribosome maturation factor RimP